MKACIGPSDKLLSLWQTTKIVHHTYKNIPYLFYYLGQSMLYPMYLIVLYKYTSIRCIQTSVLHNVICCIKHAKLGCHSAMEILNIVLSYTLHLPNWIVHSAIEILSCCLMRTFCFKRLKINKKKTEHYQFLKNEIGSKTFFGGKKTFLTQNIGQLHSFGWWRLINERLREWKRQKYFWAGVSVTRFCDF